MRDVTGSCRAKGLLATLCNAFCLLLLILFLLQSFLLGMLLTVGEIPVPAFLVNRLNHALEAEGFRFEARNVRLDSRGYLHLDRPRLVHVHSGEPAVQAEAVLLEFAVWALPAGQFLVQGVHVADGAIWLPPVYSPTGQREALVSRLYLEAEKRHNGWDIERGIFSFEGIETRVEGFWPHRPVRLATQTREAKESDGISLQDRLASVYRAFQRLLVARPFLEAIKNPVLSLKSFPEESGGVVWEVYAQGSGWQHEDWELGNWSGQVRGRVTARGTLVWPSRMEVMGTHFHKKDLFEGAEGSLALFWNPHQQDWKPHSMRAWVWRPGFERLQGTWLALDAAFPDYTEFDFSARIAVDEVNVVNASGILNVEEKSLQGNMKGQVNPDLVWGSPFLGGLQRPDNLDYSHGLRFNVEVSLQPEFQLDKVSGRLYVRDVRYDGLTVSGGLLEGYWSGEEIFFDDVMLHSGTYRVEGSYWQNLRTQDYRFLLEGTVQPGDLNQIVDEEWWTELWEQFAFSGDLPSANIDLRSRYDSEEEFMRIFLFADLEHFHYKGEYFDHLELYLAQNPLRISLFDAKLRADDGQANFDLQWDRKAPEASLDSLAFRGSISVPLERAARVIDPEVEEIAADFDITGRNFIRANGLLFREESDRADTRYLKIWGDIPDGLTYADYDLDAVRFVARSNPNGVVIDPLDFVLAGGKGTGKATLTGSVNSDRSLDFDLKIRKARLGRLFHTVAFLKEAVKEMEDTADRTGVEGYVDLDIKALGLIGEVESFKGSGYLIITEADLGDLHLFGILSRFMGSLGINFGSFSFNRASTHVEMRKGNLHLPDLVVSGPSANLEASGNLGIEDVSLDFVLTFRPFGAVRLPVLSQVLDVFSPLANTVAVRMTGSLKDPQFSTSFQPLRILTGQETVEPETE